KHCLQISNVLFNSNSEMLAEETLYQYFAEFVLDMFLKLLFPLNIQKRNQFLVERQNDRRVIGTVYYVFELANIIPLQIILRQSISNYFLRIRNALSLNCFSLRFLLSILYGILHLLRFLGSFKFCCNSIADSCRRFYISDKHVIQNYALTVQFLQQ